MMTALSRAVLGPRIPPEDFEKRRFFYLSPAITLTVARVLLLVSLFLPYWEMTLEAPQYPDGLHVSAFVNGLEGDVAEIDGLNHYIGMRPLEQAAQLERALSIYMIIALVLLVEGAVYVRSRWAVLLVVPSVLFPAVFLIDLHFWLDNFGQNLDPTAPLSNAIDPFTPPVLGTGVIGQFRTHASAGVGWWFALAAAGLTVVGMLLHRRAFKPLHDAVHLHRSAAPAAAEN